MFEELRNFVPVLFGFTFFLRGVVRQSDDFLLGFMSGFVFVTGFAPDFYLTLGPYCSDFGR